MRKLALFVFLAILPFGAFAAQLVLSDGTILHGQFISGTTTSIIFRSDDGVRRRFDMRQIQSIDFGARRPANAGYDPYGRHYDSNGANRVSSEREFVSLPAGTQISVRTEQSIRSTSAAPGQFYPATIVQDVIDPAGSVVIPRGSEAQLVVNGVREGGTLRGADLVLDLDSIRVNGRRYIVSTTDIEAGNQGIGKNKRTAEMVGGGAALGTLLGAIAGGGKGAAIGAIAGAAAGGGAQVLTKGHEIRVPAESVLNFRLDRHLALREAR